MALRKAPFNAAACARPYALLLHQKPWHMTHVRLLARAHKPSIVNPRGASHVQMPAPSGARRLQACCLVTAGALQCNNMGWAKKGMYGSQDTNRQHFSGTVAAPTIELL